MKFLGVDLAWVPRNRTGLVAAVDGHVMDSATVVTDDEICAWLAPHLSGSAVVAVDAPLIVRNPAGTSRDCDRKITKVFGGRHAGAHSANLGLPSFTGGVRADRIAKRLGLSTDPAFDPGEAVRRIIEVYPHPAMVSLFRLPFSLKYKRTNRDFENRQAAFAELIRHLESLAGAAPPLLVASAPRWPLIREAVATATGHSMLNLVEDELDAFMCAYVGLYYWTHGSTRCRVVGDLESGYIVTPVTEGVGAALDELVLLPVVPRVRSVNASRAAGGIPPSARAAGAVTAPRPGSPSVLCGCGCGEPVRSRYLPGHDARHKEALIQQALAGERAELTLAQLGWTKFLDSRRR